MKSVNLITSIGKRIKFFRTLQKVSLSALAKEANISKSTLFSLELGETNPTIATLESIANALKIDISELINSQQENSLALIENPTHTSCALYQLKLAPFESFNYPTKNSVSLQLEVIDGSLTISSSNTTLHPQQKAIIATNDLLIANSKGATALVKIVDENSPNILKEDIIIESDSHLDISNTILQAHKNGIVRLIATKNIKIKDNEIYPYISSIKNKSNSFTSYYYIARYIGYSSSIKKIKSLFNEPQELTIFKNFITLVAGNAKLEESYCKQLQNNPFKTYEKLIIDSFNKQYPNLKTVNKEDFATLKFQKNQPYLFIDEVLNSSNSLKDTTYILNLYRAIELMVNINEVSFTKELLELYNKINSTLPEILYLALNNYINSSLSLAKEFYKEITNSLDCKTLTHYGFKIFYCELLTILKEAIDMYKDQKSYLDQTTLEKILEDLGATIYQKIQLQPGTKKSGKYLYIFEFKDE